MTNGVANEKDTLLANAVTFEREARETPEHYYEAVVSGPEADREIDELAHLSDVARDLARRDKR